MADNKKTFPMLPIAHWWNLRKKFKQSIPGVVTDSYIATVLNMEANSARANVLPFLKVLGIIDVDGKTSSRAKAWRDDEQYGEVCREIIKEIYPEELVHAVPKPAEDRSGAARWFANHTGTGAAAAKRMAALYGVIAEADASKQPDTERKTIAKRAQPALKAPAQALPRMPPPSQPLGGGETTRGVAHTKNLDASDGPGLNINVQIHISADASTDQIEQIFASMAKHLYRRA